MKVFLTHVPCSANLVQYSILLILHVVWAAMSASGRWDPGPCIFVSDMVSQPPKDRHIISARHFPEQKAYRIGQRPFLAQMDNLDLS
jgi:hypothetical protein